MSTMISANPINLLNDFEINNIFIKLQSPPNFVCNYEKYHKQQHSNIEITCIY